MKKLGIIILLIGLIGLFISLKIDTSVPSGRFGSGERVHNIGLMNEKQNAILLFSVISILGGIFFATSRSKKSHKENTSSKTEQTDDDTRPCPYCAEKIKSQAILCRFCGKQIDPLDEKESLKKEKEPTSQTDPVLFDRIAILSYRTSKIVEQYFSSLAENSTSKKSINQFKRIICEPSSYTLAIGFIFFSSSIYLYLYLNYFKDWSEVFTHSQSLKIENIENEIKRVKAYGLIKSIILFLSGILFFCTKISSSKKNIYTPQEKEPSSSIYFLGEHINACVLVSILVACTFWLQSNNELDLARLTAFSTIVISFLLFKKGYKIFSFLMIATSLYYLLLSYTVFNTINYAFKYSAYAMTRSPLNYLLSPSTYLALLLSGALLPHLRVVRLGGFTFGKTHGDFKVTISNHTIYFPIVSALFLYIWTLGVREVTYLISSFI